MKILIDKERKEFRDLKDQISKKEVGMKMEFENAASEFHDMTNHYERIMDDFGPSVSLLGGFNLQKSMGQLSSSRSQPTMSKNWLML